MTPRWLPTALSAVLLLQACVHEMIPIPPPPKPPVQSGGGDTTSPTPPSFYANGVWQATIDGVTYSGSIDTSWSTFDSSFNASHPDSSLFCTGSTSDKRANIHFIITTNRFLTGIPNISSSNGAAQLIFDQGSDTLLETGSAPQAGVDFYIDSISNTVVRGHFSGTLGIYIPGLGLSTGGHTVTNGTFTAGWHGRGVVQNSFVFTGPTGINGATISHVNGYFNSATMSANTLYLDGQPTDPTGQGRFRLQLHTGGTIKPGVYSSANGDAGMVLYFPSVDRDYITDSAGSLTVTITQVDGNVVYGNFSGSDYGSPISNGSFAARIKNYTPEADSANKWGFGIFNGGFPDLNYYIYGGNVLNAAVADSGGRYYLAVNGQSDLGASMFKFVISSTNPIAAGAYTDPQYAYQGGTNTVDSFYFNSGTQYIGLSNFYELAPTTVEIDSINAHHVWGKLKGGVSVATGGTGHSTLQLGKFSASF